MKKMFIFLVLLCFVFFIGFEVKAEEYEEDFGTAELYEEVPEDGKDMLSQIGIDEVDDVYNISLEDYFGPVSNILQEKVLNPLKSLILVFAVIVLSSFLTSAYGEENKICELAGSLTVCVIFLPNIASLIITAIRVTESSSVFVMSLIPVYAVLQIASGNPAMGSSFGAVTIFFSNIVSALCRDVILPLLACFLGLSVSAAFSHISIKTACESVYKFIKWTLVLVITVFSGIISVQSALMGATDVATTKTVKFLASSAVPVVGGAFGDGISAVQNSIKVLKSGASAFGMIATVSVFLAPIIEVLLWMLSCQIALITAEIFSYSKINEILTVIMVVLKIILAVLISICVICIVSSAITLFFGA